MKKIIYLPLMILTLTSCISIENSNKISSTSQNNSSVVTSSSIEYINYEYSNPIKFDNGNGERGFASIADPFCIKADDGYYYLYSTNVNCYQPERGEVFDYGPIWRSKELTNWEYVGSVFEDGTDILKWGQNGNGIVPGVWAPNVIKVGDQYNYYYTLSAGSWNNPGIGVATAPTPHGPWTHYGKIFNSDEIGVYNSSDQDVFVDDDGKIWLIWGSGDGIYVTELSPDGIDLYGGIEYAKNNKYKIAGWGFISGTIDNFEAAHIVKKDEWYYLFLSQGGWDGGINSRYNVVVAKSKKITGGFRDSLGNDMMSSGDGDVVVEANEEGATGTGHCSVVQDDIGDYWLVYHGYDQTGNNPNTRTLFIDKLKWDEKTLMPYVENKNASYGAQLGPTIIIGGK